MDQQKPGLRLIDGLALLFGIGPDGFEKNDRNLEAAFSGYLLARNQSIT